MYRLHTKGCKMLNWVKSSYSWDWKELKCVEVATDSDGVLVRDSKNPAQSPIRLSRADWAGLLAVAKDYER